jgi:hypothetical protein
MKDISSAKQYIFDSEEDAAKAADFYRAQTGFKKMMEMPGHLPKCAPFGPPFCQPLVF